MSGSLPLKEIPAVQARLAWMREARIWPNVLRYLSTDAFGVVLLVSLWQELHDDRLLRECEWVVAEVERVLGRPHGIRIGEEPGRDGEYFHYLAMWIFTMLWTSHFSPGEPWAVVQRARALAMLDRMWVDPPGYFCREPTHRQVKFAFTNYGVSLGLQAVPAHGDRVRRLNAYFDSYRSGASTTPVPSGTSWRARQVFLDGSFSRRGCDRGTRRGSNAPSQRATRTRSAGSLSGPIRRIQPLGCGSPSRTRRRT